MAAYFGKRHDHILRDIDALVTEGVPNFGETPYVSEQNGQTYRSFDMTKDGFTLLAMGFTGGESSNRATTTQIPAYSILTSQRPLG